MDFSFQGFFLKPTTSTFPFMSPLSVRQSLLHVPRVPTNFHVHTFLSGWLTSLDFIDTVNISRPSENY